jgi:hypothetical protein
MKKFLDDKGIEEINKTFEEIKENLLDKINI